MYIIDVHASSFKRIKASTPRDTSPKTAAIIGGCLSGSFIEILIEAVRRRMADF